MLANKILLNIISEKNFKVILYYLQLKNQINFFYLEDDLVHTTNCSLSFNKKYFANLRISKNIYSRYYFRNFKDFFKLDIFNDFQYCLVYFKFFYFWNFFFLLHWVRYKNVLKKFFYNFFYNKNFMLFFLNSRKNIKINYIENLSNIQNEKDSYYYFYINNNNVINFNNIFYI